jgi:hypothetical protein
MAKITTKIIKYVGQDVNFKSDVILQDDGQGSYIKEWNLDIAKPTNEQLDSYESSAQIEENNNHIRSTRKNLYGNIGDQLDEIFKDINAWKARIQSIKDNNPKE